MQCSDADPGGRTGLLLLLGRRRRLLVRVGDDRRRVEQAGGVVDAPVRALRAEGVLRRAAEDVRSLIALAPLAARLPLGVRALVDREGGSPGRNGERHNVV